MLKQSMTSDLATMIVDCPEWAWAEVARDVVSDAEDAAFYALYAAELAKAGAGLLTDRLRAAWQRRGVDVVAFVREEDFDGWAASDEDAYFAAWDEASSGLEFAEVVRAADLGAEYSRALD